LHRQGRDSGRGPRRVRWRRQRTKAIPVDHHISTANCG
jgi:hypothetical protein